MNKITERRKATKQTQKAVAQRVGVRRETLVRWEAGAEVPERKRELLAKVLDCSVAELVEEKRQRNAPLGKTIAAIRYYRVKAGLKQGELAQLVGIHQSKLCRLEQGQAVPDADLIKLLALHLNIHPSTFSAQDTPEATPRTATPAPARRPAAQRPSAFRKNAALDDPSGHYVQLLAHYRSAAKLTLGELANQSGIPQGRVSAMENGLTPILGEDLIALSDTLGVLPDDLRSLPVGPIDACATLAQFYDMGGRHLDGEIPMPLWMHQRVMAQLGVDDTFILKQMQA